METQKIWWIRMCSLLIRTHLVNRFFSVLEEMSDTSLLGMISLSSPADESWSGGKNDSRRRTPKSNK